jgi:BirA family biotin operon repressor/biotin-[acetyl-CoA-carboxylase] ligase
MNFNKHELHSLLLHNFHYDLPVHIFELIPSTNDQMWEILAEGSITPVGAIALEQSAGRGQWSRNWESPPGGLYLSLGLSLNLPLENNFHLTLLSALGIVKKLRQEKIPVVIKWPNDLILSSKKLGGIKTEIKTQNNQIHQAVIGVGINWQNPIPNTGINLSNFHLSLEKLAALTINGIISEYQNYSEQGIEQALNSYLKLLINLGQTITFEGNKGEIIGVNANGDLRIKLSSPGATTEINLPLGTISLGYQ